MIKAAGEFVDLEKPFKKKAPEGSSLGTDSLCSYYTGDMISYAAGAGQKLSSDIFLKKLHCFPGKDVDLSNVQSADEVVTAAVYLLVRHGGDIRNCFTQSIKLTRNNKRVAFLVGALLGACKGFWELNTQGFREDLELLEKINVVQTACNDLYLLFRSKATPVERRLSSEKQDLRFTEDTSDDFINRWGFQDIADHVFDPRITKWAHPTSELPGGARFDPLQVKAGDIIFVRDIELFMKEMHPKIQVPYTMLTHGEYRDTVMEYHLSYLDDPKIIAWFSIHPPLIGHPKFFPLPLGTKQDEDVYKNRQQVHTTIKKVRKNEKSKMLYMNMSLEQDPERVACHKLLSEKPFCCNRSKKISFIDYLEEMSQYKFAVSPRGWGPDCYRTWEALLVGTIPIVRRCQFDQYIARGSDVADCGQTCSLTSDQGSQLDRLYEDLPILVIDEWEEITEEFLEQKYAEIQAKTSRREKLYLEYWKQKILHLKKIYKKRLC